jgi:hypothetical protein
MTSPLRISARLSDSSNIDANDSAPELVAAT